MYTIAYTIDMGPNIAVTWVPSYGASSACQDNNCLIYPTQEGADSINGNDQIV